MIYIASSSSVLAESRLELSAYLTDKRELALVLLCRFTDDISSSFLSQFPFLLHVVTVSTATTHIDLSHCSVNNIKVHTLFDDRNALSAISSSSEHALMLCLMAIKSVHLYSTVLSFSSRISNSIPSVVQTVSSISVGIIGFGRIGSYVGRALEFLGCASIKYYDPLVTITSATKVDHLNDLLDCSTILISCTADSSSQNLVNSDFFRYSKANRIINISRESCVNPYDLLTWLHDPGNSYYTDVLDSTNSVNILAKLKTMPNIFFSEHTGGLSYQSVQIADKIAIKKSLSLLQYTS